MTPEAIGKIVNREMEMLREITFLRKQLRIIADRPRHTMEQRLAASALTFWDEVNKEAALRH
jgi:hypothetical protein